jgi:hypothetical protein
MNETTEKLLLYGLIGVAIWYVLKKGVLPGVRAVSDAVSWTIADFYTWAVLERQNMNLLGNIQLPDGTLIPLQTVDVRQDPDGATIALYNGSLYQLYPSDANGNWPAVPL